MIKILSQKVDDISTYQDILFQTYHFPSRYLNQLNVGDIFVYYQGDRHKVNNRYYFGVGRVAEIQTNDKMNYYATLVDCKRFKHKVPIYLPEGGYVEQLDYDTVRKSITPPWQSSVRPLSQKAFEYILNASGIHYSFIPLESLELLREKLKDAVRAFFVENEDSAIILIGSIASEIINATVAKAESFNVKAEESNLTIGVTDES